MNNTPISKCEEKNPIVCSVESVSDLKKFSNTFVYVTSIDTTFYVDCSHRITILSSGVVSVYNYDTTTNPNGLRNQFAFDNSNNSLFYFNVKGEATLVNSASAAIQFADLLNRPSYAGQPMTGATSIPAVPTTLADLSDGSRVSTLEENVAQLQNENQVPNLDVLTDAIIDTAPSGVSISHTSQNLVTGHTSTSTVELPMATDTQTGLMNSTDHTALTSLQATVATLTTDSEGNTADITGLQTQINNLTTSLDEKQDTLVSGINIKTINGEPVIGDGDINISTTNIPILTQLGGSGSSVDGVTVQLGTLDLPSTGIWLLMVTCQIYVETGGIPESGTQYADLLLYSYLAATSNASPIEKIKFTTSTGDGTANSITKTLTALYKFTSDDLLKFSAQLRNNTGKTISRFSPIISAIKLGD